MGGYAWVTLATNNSYSLGALVLAHSLKKANTAHKLAVLITPAVSQSMREQLQTVFDHVKVVDVLDSKDEAHLALLKRPELGITFTKIHCWRLVEFEKCVFLDADTLVVRNCDELFEKEEFSAAPDVSWPDCFNSGVFVYRPSVDTFNKLLQFAVENRSFDGGDQGLLNQFFSGWATEDIKKHLPFVYNLTSVAAYSYIPAFKHYGSETRIVHFIGEEKPWLQQLDSATKTVTPPSGSEHLAPLLQQWWDLFCEKVHPNLDKNLEISNDGMSHPPEEVRSNFLPIALSDEPQGALVAEPCTPYREKNDFRQHNLPYLPFNVEGPSGEFLNVEYLHVSSSPPHVETEENGEEQQWREEVPQEDRNEETLEEKKGDCDHELNEGEKEEVQREVQQQENQQQEKQQQEEQSKEQKQEEPPLPKDPFDYHSFFPDETCINNYLEKNLETYQPFHDYNTSVNVLEPEVSPTLPRFLTIPQNDQRQSGNLEQQEERKEEEEKEEEIHKNELPNHPERELRVESNQVPRVEPEKRELSKSKSMSCFPWDILDSELSPPRPIWKSQPELNVDRKYSMPKLKPILPKQRSFSKSIPSVVSKVTVYTEFIFSSEYKDPVDLPKDKTGFIESHIRKEAKLRRSKSDADIQDRFGPLPYAPYPEVAKPVPKPKKILPRHLLDEYFDLSRCKRQMGNKPKSKDDRRKDSIHTLPALKPIVPGKDKKSTLIKKRKSKELSPGDGGKEKMLKRDSEYNKENQQPKIIQTNVDEILKRLREFSKNYQHFFGETNTLQSKQVICKNATVQTTGEEEGECGTSEEFVSRTVAGSRNSKETQTSKGVKEMEFRQLRDYIKDQKKTSQKGLLGLQDILSESKTEKEEKPKLDKEEQPNSKVTVIPNGAPTKAPTLQNPLEESSNPLESKHKENRRQSKTDFQTLPVLTTEKSGGKLPNPQKTIPAPSSANGSNTVSSSKQPPGNKSKPPEPVTTALNDERELEPAKPSGRKENKKPNSKGLKTQNGHVTPQDNGCPREINIAPEKKKILKPEEMLCVPDFETPRSSRVVPGIVKPAENFRTAAPQIKNADTGETPENGVENGHEAPPHGSPTVGCSEDLKPKSGIAGAIAQLNLEGGAQQSQASAAASTAQEEYLRRQNWETGKMDYMGKDSFDNIWSKICQTIEAKNLEEAAGSPQQLADKVLEAATTESPVSLSAILQKCPEYIETLPGELAAGSVEDDEIIFSKQPENKQTNLTNIAEEEEAGVEGSVKLSDILGDTKAPKKPECKVPLTTANGRQAETKTQPPSDTTSENVQKQPEMQPQPADSIKQMQGEVKPKPEEKPECKTVAVIPQPSQAVVPQVSTPIPDGQKPPEVKSQSVAAAAVTPQPSQQPEVKSQSVLASPVTPQPSLDGQKQPDAKPQSNAVAPQTTSEGQKQQGEVKPQSVLASPVTPQPSLAGHEQPDVKPEPVAATPQFQTLFSDGQKQTEVKPQPVVAASVVPPPTSDVQRQLEVKPQPVPATPQALTPIPDGQKQTEVKPQSDAVVPVPPQLTTEGQKQPEAKPQPLVTAPVVPTPSPELQKQPEVKPQPSVTPQTASADAIAQPKPEPSPPTPTDSQKQSEVQPQPTSQPSDGKPENKTATTPTPQTQSTEETKPLISECKTVAIPSAPIIYPGAPTGQQDKKPEEKPQVKLEPIPLPPPETTSQESVKPDSGKEEGIKEEGKSKKGVFSKLLEMVGVAPKEKNGSDPSKSVFYDVEESAEVKETEKPAETDKQSQELEKPKQSPIPKPERSSSPKDTKSDSIQVAGTRKSPSPKLTIPPKLPETEVTTPTPPPHPDAPPRKNSALLKVDDTILETPPVAEVQGGVTTEIEDIIGKAKSEVESLLQEKEAGEGSEPVNAMKLLMGEEEAKKGGEEEVEELRVTTEEERMRHKGEVVTSKLSDQILKAIPPPRRKAISEASTSAIPKPEQKPPGAEGKAKPGKPSSIPVPPPRNKGKPSPPSPPKTKGKK